MPVAAQVHVTKHALRRYLERAWGVPAIDGEDSSAIERWAREGIDLARARDQIHRATNAAAQVGATSVKFGNIRFLLKNLVVVTVVPVGGLCKTVKGERR